MSAPCASPALCGTLTHADGEVRPCANFADHRGATGASPQVPQVSEADLADLRADLAAGDPPGWTSGGGRPHPTGDYHWRQVSAKSGTGVAYVAYRDADGRLHRADGPAEHIAGAPAIHHFRHHGSQVVVAATVEADAATTGFYEQVLAGHLSPAQAYLWLLVAGGVGQAQTVALMGAGADSDLALDAIDAGVVDQETLTQVATGALPLSWALAGVGR